VTRSSAEYERDFVVAVCAALDGAQADRAEFAAHQLHQVAAVNRTQTWDLRALEWEQAAVCWLRQRRG
jgi:hypothetical protein